MCASEATGSGYMDAKFAYLYSVIAIRVSFLCVFYKVKKKNFSCGSNGRISVIFLRLCRQISV